MELNEWDQLKGTHVIKIYKHYIGLLHVQVEKIKIKALQKIELTIKTHSQ